MIDIHAHIIHGVDDGPKSLDDALALLRQAIENGVTHVIATPHYKLPVYDNQDVNIRYQELLAAISKHQLPITLHLGNELYLEELLIDHLSQNKALPLNQSQYLLVELPTQRLYPVHLDQLFHLQRMGYTVVIAHVDRYDYFIDHPEQLKALIDQGCLGQMSAQHIISDTKHSLKWIKAGYVHFIASDMHHTQKRPNQMAKALQIIQKNLGSTWGEQLFHENPHSLLNKQKILRMPTQEIKKSWLAALIG